MKNKLVVVFGGSGFLGSHLADTLLDRGFKVRIFDKEESSWLKPEFEMVKGDILNLDAVVKACEGAEYVYNLAGLADIDDARKRPVDTVHLNVLGNVHVLEGARRAGCRRFIYASSVYVYSEAGSFYRVSKQAAEKYVEAYQTAYGLPFTILRYGSLYGPRADRRNGIYRLLYTAIADRKLVIPGSGNELRDYIHVKDAASSSVHVLEPEFENQHVILSGHERMKVKDMATMVKEMLGDDVDIEIRDEMLEGHYSITPYSFHPKLGKKYVPNTHIDLGQGILDCIAETYEKISKEKGIDPELAYGK